LAARSLIFGKEVNGIIDHNPQRQCHNNG
ncbi:hypothetical protein D049_3179B, partial [Vibrio parahaemolyticus VPTS-2010]